jgi:hypothetical protein
MTTVVILTVFNNCCSFLNNCNGNANFFVKVVFTYHS